MYITERMEKQLQYAYCAFLILFNVACLYFIVDLMFYDEIAGSLLDRIANHPQKKFAYILFINGIFNLYFVCVSLMARLFNR